MLDFKFIADAITFVRGLLGMWMVFLGLTLGKESMPSIIVLMLLCWTGDYFDGRVARMSSSPRSSWIGDHDIQVDILVSLCVGAYLVLADYVPLIISIFYLTIWVLIFMRSGLNHGLLMLVQAPMYVLLIYFALHEEPDYGKWLLYWLVGLVLLNWKHFISDVVPGFLKDFLDSLQKSRES